MRKIRMKYIAKTISDFIIEEIQKLTDNPNNQGREMRIILPSFPAPVVFRLGKELEEYRLHQAGNGNRIKLIYKCAYALGKAWKESNDPVVRATCDKIIKNDWYDTDNQLTQWRNIQRDTKAEHFLATVLVGCDRVTDQSSLADFFKLDHQTLWKRVLRGRFAPWIEACLKEKPLEYEEDHVNRIDEILSGLVDASIADLTGVSTYLEHVDLSMAMDGGDALKEIVRQLDHFKLPCMVGLGHSRLKRKKSVAQYLAHALEFFNYGKFLEANARKKALKSVVAFENNVDLENLDPELLGDYHAENAVTRSSLEAFIQGLKRYIETNDSKEREGLRSVDFVFLLDKVLGAKEPGPKKPPAPKKLSGSPLQAVLRAVWLTLGEFKKSVAGKKVLLSEALTDIEIRGDLFKHDCDGDNAQELKLNANRFLHQIIGGLDKYLEDQLAFVPDPINDPERTIRVNSSLCPDYGEQTLGYERTRSGEPYLKFTVTIAAGEQTEKRAFIWRVPRLHAYCTMADLFGWFCSQADGNPVPVFCIPYFEELMLAKDEEEVNRILQQALQDSSARKLFNLLDAPDIDTTDPAAKLLKQLGYKYTRFLAKAHEQGIFSALKDFPLLEKAFRDAYAAFLNDPDCAHSQVGPLLLKAFCMLGVPNDTQGDFWMWRAHEPAFAVTLLHPALIEMLFHQHAFICESFVAAARQELRQWGSKSFSERRWADIEDLAEIQWPLHGTLRGDEQILDTNMRNFSLVHLVGESPQQEATLTTRLLLRYDTDEDDDITDEELFRETRESRMVQRVLMDYRSLTPYANDGIAVAAYCTTNIQFLISGIHAFLREVFNDRPTERPYTLSLTLFAESQDDTTAMRWVREWRERWEAAEPSSKLSYYRGCRISVAHRMITRERNYAQFVSLLNSIDADVAFLFQFIRAGASGSRFVKTESYDHSGSFRMFPVLEKMCCSVIGGGQTFTRERIISNRQFKLGTLHSGVMAKLKHMADSQDGEYVVMGRGDFSRWIKVVDELHKRSAWVVCVDPSVDEHLIAKEDAYGKRLREIIGFGSGVGAHGEYNYTVSTEEYSLMGVRDKIRAHVAAKLGPWDPKTCDQVAESVLGEVPRMAGMSLVKATGPSEYVRDFIAYALVRKLLPPDPTGFCDEIVSLDAFRHWFDSAPSSIRPDLLHLRAKIENGVFKISAQLIECKLAQQSERHLEKAREQLECGLNHLIACFRPRQDDTPEGLDDRPDQRYWWLQLHRLLASKGQIHPHALTTTVSAFEKLSDGFFDIRWSAAAVTFWNDSDRSDICKDDEWEFQYEDNPLPIQIISAGRQFVRVLCTEDGEHRLPVDAKQQLSFTSRFDKHREEEVIGDPDEDLGATSYEPGASRGIVSKEYSKVTGVGKPTDNEVIPTPALPQRIFLGKGVKSSMELYWEFGHPDLANRHMLIFGTSGMGKTYTIQALLYELGKHGQNSLIVDYTNGFHEHQLEEETLEFLKPKQHTVKLSGVPINPLRRQQEVLGGQTAPEDASNTAQRVAGVFSEVYELGDQQWSAIYSAVKRGIDIYGDEMSLDCLPELLKKCATDGTSVASSATSVISKIQPFVDMNPFGQEDPQSWERIFTDSTSRCHILQLAGYFKDAARLITEFSLIDLYWYYRIHGKKDRPIVIVLDEIQNLDQRLESPLGKFLTEGRKFGICLIMATQTLSNFHKEQRDRLFQASHKLFFRPAETEVKSYAQILESATDTKAEEWVYRLSSLKKGECYSLGPTLNPETGGIETKAIKIRIATLPERVHQKSS